MAIGSKVTSLSVDDRVIHPFQGKGNWIGFGVMHGFVCEDDCFVILILLIIIKRQYFTINPMTAYMC